jgi:hypothetical protein
VEKKPEENNKIVEEGAKNEKGRAKRAKAGAKVEVNSSYLLAN